jgi:penicillin-binding protein 1B
LLGLAVTLSIIVVATWLFRLDQQIAERFAGKRFAPPVEFYSAPEAVRPGSLMPANYFESVFARLRYRSRSYGQSLQLGDYSVWSAEQCQSVVATPPALAPPPTPSPPPSEAAAPPTIATTIAPTAVAKCVAWRNAQDLAARGPDPAEATGAAGEPTPSEASTPIPEQAAPLETATPPGNPALPEQASPLKQAIAPGQATLEEPAQIVALDADGRVLATFSGATPQPSPAARLAPELFAQYYGDKPTLRTVVPLGAVPNNCINALIAIEDSSFWEHSGVSLPGLARAAWVFLRSGRASQGGSTITQQLVKNYFLTDERTIKRKVVEFAMALLVEGRQTKPDILETYINLIYMGQNGAFQVRGWAAAANHYFGQDIQELSLPQCALMASIVNSPGLYNPFAKPDNALKRRAKVLDRMVDLKMIDAAQAAGARAAALPARPQRALSEPAPYFVQAVRRQLREQGIDDAEGLRVYTTLNLRAQEAAQQAVRNGLARLEATFPEVKKKKEQGKLLEAALLAADPATGHIQAIVGGRNYLTTQFNRAFESRRQVGSVMKPFTFLAALEATGEDGKPYGPLSIVKDAPFTHKYEGQSWSPRNYEGKHFGDVPMYFALKESLNAATASLGLAVGLGNIVDVARRLGVQSKLETVPSLTLGAFELYPWEVAQAYGTISRFGSRVPLTFIERAEALDGRALFAYAPKAEQVVAPETMAVLVGMMKHTLISGSARGARLAGFANPAAGKTGTTNDKKDAWFAGFTPYHTAVVWVGYDDNSTHNLSGGSGAVPLWTAYMKAYGATFPADDFKWPEGAQAMTVPSDLLRALGVPADRGARPDAPPSPVELVFKQGQAPAGTVPAGAPAAATPAPPASR